MCPSPCSSAPEPVAAAGISAIPAITGVPGANPIAEAGFSPSRPATPILDSTGGIFSMGIPTSRSSARDQSRLLIPMRPVPPAPVWSITMRPVARKTRYPVVSRNLLMTAKSSGRSCLNQSILGMTSLPVGTPAAIISTSLFPPSVRMMRAACASPRLSIQLTAIPWGEPSARMGTSPSICPANPRPATRPGSMPLRASTSRVQVTTACHQSSGSCSAQWGLGW